MLITNHPEPILIQDAIVRHLHVHFGIEKGTLFARPISFAFEILKEGKTRPEIVKITEINLEGTGWVKVNSVDCYWSSEETDLEFSRRRQQTFYNNLREAKRRRV